MDHFDPTRPKRRNVGSTWGQLRPARPQLRPNLDPLGSRPNLAPTWSAQVEVHMVSKWWHSRPISKSSRCPFSLVFSTLFDIGDASLKQCYPCYGSFGPTWCRQRVPSCAMLHVTWTSMCITWLQFGVHLNLGSGPVQDSATWGQVGPSSGPGPSWAQPRPIVRTQCNTLKTCIFTAIPTFLGFDARLCCPHLGMSWAQLRRQMPPRKTKLHILSPTCFQTCPSCAMVGLKLGPSWSQLARVRHKLHPSWAQVGSCVLFCIHNNMYCIHIISYNHI